MPQPVATERLEAHWEEVAGWLTRRVGDPTLAADLTQEAYLRAAALPPNTVLMNARAWLFHAARNLLIDHLRRTRVRANLSEGDAELASVPDCQPRADAVLLCREELSVLERAVQQLPPRTREVFCLHKFEGRSYTEIAEQLGIAKNTVMVHMVKALRLCREALNAYRAGNDPTNAEKAAVRLSMHEY